MKVVVDATVALKWLFRTHDDEPDVDPALELLRAVFEDRLTLVQPPHFVAEVSAALAREAPATARLALRDLLDIEMQIVDDEPVYSNAMRLSARLDYHVFDTLYHAVALADDSATLVTADESYYRKARAEGRIERLANFHMT